MKIMVNGKQEVLKDSISIGEYIMQKGLNPDTVVVEHNYNIIQKEEWSNVFLKENDVLEVLRFVGGG